MLPLRTLVGGIRRRFQSPRVAGVSLRSREVIDLLPGGEPAGTLRERGPFFYERFRLDSVHPVSLPP